MALHRARRRSWLQGRALARLHIFRHGDAQAQAIAHHLDGAFLCRMTMDLRVALVEFFARTNHGGGIEMSIKQAVERRAQLVALSGVAHVEFAAEACVLLGHAFGLQLLTRLGFEPGIDRLGMFRADLVERHEFRADVVMHHVGAEQAQRREGARTWRHEDAPHVELFRHGGGMDRARAAEGQQREGREIDAALGGKHAHLVGHAHVDDAPDSRRSTQHIHAELVGDMLLDGAVRGRDVKFLRAAEKILGVEIAADHVRIGDGRARAAASVAGGAGISARALRADGKEACAIDGRERTAAGGDGCHVQRRHVDLTACDGAFGHFQRHAAFDEGDVGAGAAHVEGDEAGLRIALGEIGACLCARSRAGEQRMHGLAAADGGDEGHDAAVRLHEEALAGAHARLVEALVQMIDVANQHRLQIGIEQGGRHARPFAQARQHFAGDRDADARRLFLDDAARLFLMLRIHEGEEVADRNRLAARIAQLARGLAHGVAVERDEHVACIVGAFGNLPRQALRRDGRRLGVEIVEQVAVARLLLDFLHGAIALGDEHADLGAAHFKQRIGGDRRAMGKELDGSRIDTARSEFRHAVQDAERRVLRSA